MPRRRRRAGSVHPLFDPTSYYRIACRDVLAQDQGRQSVRDFFSAAALHALEGEWMYDTPASPQDWGYPPAVNRAIHEAMAEGAQAEQELVFQVKATLPLPSMFAVGNLNDDGPSILWGTVAPVRECLTGPGRPAEQFRGESFVLPWANCLPIVGALCSF